MPGAGDAGGGLGEGRRRGCGAVGSGGPTPGGLRRLAGLAEPALLGVGVGLNVGVGGRCTGLGAPESAGGGRIGSAGLTRLADPALLGVGVGLNVGVSGRRTGLSGCLRGTCGEGARLLLWGRPGGQVGLRRAPRSGLGAGSRTRDGTGRLPRNLLLGARGVEHVLVDEDGPGVKLVALIGAGRAGGRRLGCVVVRHEVPLSRVQHHAIPDPHRKTHRHPDRPEANALTAGPAREPGNPLGSCAAAATSAPATTKPRRAAARRGSRCGGDGEIRTPEGLPPQPP